MAMKDDIYAHLLYLDVRHILSYQESSPSTHRAIMNLDCSATMNC